MTRAAKDLHRLTSDFLEERESFWGFHEGFLARWTRLDPDGLAGSEHAAWNEIYAWILTSIPDPVSEEDGARGVIGEAELRHRLQRHPLLAAPR